MAAFRNREGGSQPPYKRRFSPIFSPEKIGCPSGMRTKAARLQEPNHSGVGEGFHPLPPVIHPETIAFRLRMVPTLRAGTETRPYPVGQPPRSVLLLRGGFRGNPSLGFPHAKNVHWTLFAPLPEFPLRSAGLRPAPGRGSPCTHFLF